jgi:glycine C-acetyltransferase
VNTVLRDQIGGELDGLREARTYKRFNVLGSPQGPVVTMEGRGEVVVLSSNNYLGLAAHPDVVRAGIEGLERYGAGTASVRFICGTFQPHLGSSVRSPISPAPSRRSPTSRAGTRTRRSSPRSPTRAR